MSENKITHVQCDALVSSTGSSEHNSVERQEEKCEFHREITKSVFQRGSFLQLQFPSLIRLKHYLDKC